MPARMHDLLLPPSARKGPRSCNRPARFGGGIRLPWWAVALPSAVFAALLMLIGASGARAAGGWPSAAAQLVRQIQEVVGPGP